MDLSGGRDRQGRIRYLTRDLLGDEGTESDVTLLFPTTDLLSWGDVAEILEPFEV